MKLPRSHSSSALIVAAGLLTIPTQAASYLVLSSGSSFPASLARSVQAAGGTVTARLDALGLAVVESTTPGFAARAAALRGIRSVVPDARVQWLNRNPVEVALAEYGDPPASGDDDTRFDLQWGHTAIEAPAAWNLGQRGAGALVAVLDGGFDLDHPDLAPNLVYPLCTSFVPGEPVDYLLPDPFSHGTHVAGTIAAADNARGTIGVAPEAKLMLVKVLGDSGSGSFSGIIQGIVYAAQSDADVINMSLGAVLPKSGFLDDNGTTDPSDDVWVGANEVSELRVALGRATSYAYQLGTTVIASAGNDANDGDHDRNVVHLPSDCPHVLSISATAPIGWALDPFNTFLDYPASYSNYGQSAIDLAAPGGDAAYPGNETATVGGITRPAWVFDLVFSTGSSLVPGAAAYYWSAGTSMAAPHASGVAALIVGKAGGSLPPAQVEAILRGSAEDLGKPGNDDFYGGGRVNARRAVE